MDLKVTNGDDDDDDDADDDGGGGGDADADDNMVFSCIFLVHLRWIGYVWW